MRGKTKAYLALSVLGLLFAALAAFWLADSLTRAQTGLAVGIGTSMFGFGIAKFLVGHWEEKRRRPCAPTRSRRRTSATG